MVRIEKIDESNRQWAIDSLRSDVIGHVFGFYDLQYDPENTTMYAAVENGRLRGYVLIYRALDFPSVVLECDDAIIEELIRYAPADGFVMHAPPCLFPKIKKSFPSAKHYLENWMLVEKGGARFFRSEHVRKLGTADGSKLASLLSTRDDRPEESEGKYADWIRRMPIYGVFVGGNLVSYAGSFVQTPQVWMIGGVYTHPSYRCRGYATIATSAVTEEALEKSGAAALFVRSDNYPAIRAYEKVGYASIGEKLWVDVGTGRRP
jgi:ribosomal protein S18 acetylase RimI-like enzyme